MDPDIPSVYIPAVMGIIATLFALYIANSILIFQTLSDYRKGYNDEFFIEKGEDGISYVYAKIPPLAQRNPVAKEKLDHILDHLEDLNKEIDEKLNKKEEKKRNLQDNIDNIDAEMKELEEHQIEDLNRELESKKNKLEELSSVLDDIINELNEKIKLIDYSNLKNFNYRYDKRIRSFNDIFVILSIFVIIFEIYNGMLLYYYNPKILMNFMLSFVYFVTLVVVIIAITCDFLYYTVYSQNPTLFGNNYRKIFIIIISSILLCFSILIAIFYFNANILSDFLSL